MDVSSAKEFHERLTEFCEFYSSLGIAIVLLAFHIIWKSVIDSLWVCKWIDELRTMEVSWWLSEVIAKAVYDITVLK